MRVMIFGAGRLAATVADVVRSCGHTVTGFVDADDALIGKEAEPGGARVLMSEDDFFELLDEDESDFDAVALAVSDNKARLRLFFELNETTMLPPFVHPSAVVSSTSTVGAAAIVLPLSVVGAGAEVGRAAFIGAGAVIEEFAKIGDAARVGAHATVCCGVAVGERVALGEGATVSDGVSVGADATLGSSAVLTRDVAEGKKLVAPAALSQD